MNKELIEKTEAGFQRSEAGRKANTRGKLAGAALRNACGANRATGSEDNLSAIEGVTFRIHTLLDGKKSFSLNPKSEGARLIVAFSSGKADADTPLEIVLYGLTLSECIAAGRPAKSPNAPGRLAVSLTNVRRVPLGDARLPSMYIEADTMMDKMRMMDQIDALASEVLETIIDAETRDNVREFILAGRETPVEAVSSAPYSADDQSASEPGTVSSPAIEEAPAVSEAASAAATDTAVSR
jgi:hypothetical protein